MDFKEYINEDKIKDIKDQRKIVKTLMSFGKGNVDESKITRGRAWRQQRNTI